MFGDCFWALKAYFLVYFQLKKLINGPKTRSWGPILAFKHTCVSPLRSCGCPTQSKSAGFWFCLRFSVIYERFGIFDTNFSFWAFLGEFKIVLWNLPKNFDRLSSIYLKIIHERNVVLTVILDFELFWAIIKFFQYNLRNKI